MEGKMMNRCSYNQNAFAGYEDKRMDSVVCPKPRRLGALHYSSINDRVIPFRWPINHQAEIGESKVGAELLDIILPEGSYSERSGSQVSSSPPFFSGSPPSRASNPVIQDEQFGHRNLTLFSPAPTSAVSPSSSRKVGGCARMKFGHKPAAVRIEGFDCLGRDRCSCSISAVA